MEKGTIDYRHHILQWKETGKTKVEYCREHALSYQTFFYHFKRMKRDSNPKEFVQIKVKEKAMEPAVGGVEFYLANGSRLVFTTGSTPAFIHQVIFGC